jgi:hypothetical protein
VTEFALRAPWYVREREQLGVLDPAALRPAIQMYDDTNFVRRITADPRDSLAFDNDFDDVWSYPVPVNPVGRKGRARLTPWDFVTTRLRKLYQPSHNRFYVVVVEVFCDQPGLPRAGKHDDIEVGFVLRRQYTAVSGPRAPQRHLARDLMKQLAAQQHLPFDDTVGGLRDTRDLWWADYAARQRFSEDHAADIAKLDVDIREQGWFTHHDKSQGRWRQVTSDDPELEEETFPMWRLPPREGDCAAASTRSTWFGLIPTYSGEHYPVRRKPRPKYDTQAIYEIRCFVRQRPQRGKEKCPPRIWWSQAPTEPFRIADPMDPQGTSKRLTSITLPDLRRLAARAGRPMGPGGVAITTPPKSQFVFDPFNGIPKSGAIGAGGGVCTFALELFFLVAFFLFLLFLPIVVIIFQLWWLLALRFCLPPSASINLVSQFFAGGGVMTGVEAPANASVNVALNARLGLDVALLASATGTWPSHLAAGKDAQGNPAFPDSQSGKDLLQAVDPAAAVKPQPPAVEPVPSDPLCPVPTETPPRIRSASR